MEVNSHQGSQPKLEVILKEIPSIHEKKTNRELQNQNGVKGFFVDIPHIL